MTSVLQNELSRNKKVLIAFDSGARTYEAQGTKIFRQLTPERFDEKFSVSAAANGITAVSPGDAYPQRDVKELGSITVSQQAYKGSIPVDFLMKEFDNYGVVMREAEKQGYRAVITLDQIMANVLLGAETSTTTWDGAYLASATHSIGDTGNTQSNIVTGAMSESVIDQARVKLRTQKDHANQVAPYTGSSLVVPEALGMTAFKLLYSTQGPETANRETGFLYKQGIKPIVWSLLDATNATDSHLVADKMFNELVYCVKVMPRIHYRVDTATGSSLYQIEFSAAAGAADYLGYVLLNAA